MTTGVRIVVKVDATGSSPGDLALIKAVAINVTSQPGTSITPAPVRGSMAPGAIVAAGAKAMPSTFYLTWPVQLSGDTVPTVAVSILYRPQPQSVKTTTTGKSDETVTTTNTPSSDQWISVLNMTLPQVHPLYYYNISTGVVVSTLHNPSFYRTQLPPDPNAASNAKPTYTTTTDRGDPQVFPVLMFTAYIKGFDSERNWRPWDLVPRPAFGFALNAPSSNFFFGGTAEFRRNLQFTAGVHLGKINALAPTGYVDPTSSTAPATKQNYGKGAFFGLTLNIDFIKGLFSGSSSKSGS